ncbi:LPXTG cell wall anchor domain-containing protein, partial [Listeria monocytogenes]|nr:LPXTG cell wall anchor domain-containing protein [Listeria monocytogenes]
NSSTIFIGLLIVVASGLFVYRRY